MIPEEDLIRALVIGIQAVVELGERRGAAVGSRKKTKRGSSGCDVLEEDFRDSKVRKRGDQRGGGGHKVIPVARRLAAQAGRRPKILTGIQASHRPGDEAEREHNGKGGSDHRSRAEQAIAGTPALHHDAATIRDRTRSVN